MILLPINKGLWCPLYEPTSSNTKTADVMRLSKSFGDAIFVDYVRFRPQTTDSIRFVNYIYAKPTQIPFFIVN